MSTAKQFCQQIAKSFNLNELEQLAFALGIDWDELDGRTKSNKIQSLISHCQRYKLLPQLITTLHQERPADQWLDAAELAVALTTATPSDPQQRNRKNILNNIHYTWIEGVLEPALHHDIVLALGLAYQHDALNRPHRSLYPEEQPIPPQTTIGEIFAARGRALLILGEPASGKTIALLQLLQELLTAAQTDPAQPIPIVLNLSSWARDRAALTDWIVEELLVQYQAPRQLSRDWLAANQLTLLLDGLDEVAADHRDACVEAINTFKADHAADMVVCSRLADYEQLQARLNLSAAIRIQPLTTTQIDNYLASFGPPLADLRQAVAADDEWRELAQSPLMLNLMAFTYSEATLPEGMAVTGKQQLLLAAYVHRTTQHRPLSPNNPYDAGQALLWLHNLARQLQEHDQTTFYIERLQPSWLSYSRPYHWLVKLISGLIGGLTSGLALGLFVGLISEMVLGLGIGLTYGLLIGFIFARIVRSKEKVQLIEEVQWQKPVFSQMWQKFKGASRSSLKWGSIFGLLTGLVNWLIDEWDSNFIFTMIGLLITGVIFWLVFSLIGGLIGELIGGLPTFIRTSETGKRIQPNQGIYLSWHNARRIGLFYGLLSGSILGLVLGSFVGLLISLNDPKFELRIILLFCMFLGLCIGVGIGFLKYGSETVIKHYVLRWLLARQEVLPFPFRDRDLIAYLDAMAARLLLRRVGGGWIFIHRTLLEFFADETEFQKLINELQ